MNELYNIFPNFYDVCKERDENLDISDEQRLLLCHLTKSYRGCCCICRNMKGVGALSAGSFIFSAGFMGRL